MFFARPRASPDWGKYRIKSHTTPEEPGQTGGYTRRWGWGEWWLEQNSGWSAEMWLWECGWVGELCVCNYGGVWTGWIPQSGGTSLIQTIYQRLNQERCCRLDAVLAVLWFRFCWLDTVLAVLWCSFCRLDTVLAVLRCSFCRLDTFLGLLWSNSCILDTVLPVI
jgi:hypothetical protein